MKGLFKKLLMAVSMLLFFAVSFGVLSLNAQAKNADDAAALDGVSKDSVNVTIKKPGVVLDGYDLSGYGVYIEVDNAVVKNCTGIKYVMIEAGHSGVEVSNNTIVGPKESGIYVLSNNCNITGNTITGIIETAITVNGVSDCKISKNTIIGHTGHYAIYTENCTNNEISENIIKNSYHYGMVVTKDNGSVIKGNQIINSVAAPVEQVFKEYHGDGLVVETNCKNTQILNNTIDGVTSRFTNYGNGLNVAYDSKDILVKGNIISNCGNHGMQVTYWSNYVTVDGNKITNSGNIAISVTRDSSANIVNNEVYNNIDNGIVYDVGEHDASKPVVQGSIKNNQVYSNTGNGIYLADCVVTVSGNTCKNNGECGIVGAGTANGTIDSNTLADNTSPKGLYLIGSTDFTISNNHIYKSVRENNPVGYGICLDQSAKATITNNRIVNFGYGAILAEASTTVKLSGNTAIVSGTDAFTDNAYMIRGDGNQAIYNNQLRVNSFNGSECKGQTYHEGYRAGVQIGDKVIQTYSDSNGYITVNHNNGSTDNVVFFTIDGSNNAICINGTVDFKLQGWANQEQQVREFVERFYTRLLARNGEEDGINYWTNKLVTREQTAAEVAKGFVFSDEFKDQNNSDSVFVKRLYQTFFNRSADDDQDGYNYWMDRLANGESRMVIFAGFANSPEFTTLCNQFGINQGYIDASGETQAQPKPAPTPAPAPSTPGITVDASNVDPDKLDEYVERLYTQLLGRGSEADGKKYWRETIINGCDPYGNVYDAATAARKGFIESPEYINKNKTDEEFITDLYHTFLNREPEPDGLAYWIDMLQNKGYSKQQVIDIGFGCSNEFKGILSYYGFVIHEN